MAENKKYTYNYEMPSITTDCVIFGFDGLKLNVLLIERGIEPYKGMWAFPGGFMRINETTEECAKRELEEETGLKDIFIEQLFTFSDTKRDPRGRVVSVAYFALVNGLNFKPQAGDDASKAKWFAIDEVPSLAFDHELIFRTSIQRIRGKIRYQPIGFELLSAKFSMPQLQSLYEAVLGISFDRRNFRKKILKTGLLIQLDEKAENTGHKAATLYEFDKDKYNELERRGFNFEI